MLKHARDYQLDLATKNVESSGGMFSVRTQGLRRHLRSGQRLSGTTQLSSIPRNIMAGNFRGFSGG
jgi:hypothetical protein